jgi:hypothetical protein
MNEERPILIRKILPVISTIITNDQLTEEEKFQNEVLRPILKFQHEAIITLILLSIQKFTKVDLTKIPPNELRKKVSTELSANQKTRNQLLGMILGLMSVPQLEIYYSKETELRKRIFSMLKERILDGLQREFQDIHI